VGKGGRCLRLTTSPPSCAVFIKSGDLNFLEPSGPLQTNNGTALTLPLFPVLWSYLLLSFVNFQLGPILYVFRVYVILCVFVSLRVNNHHRIYIQILWNFLWTPRLPVLIYQLPRSDCAKPWDWIFKYVYHQQIVLFHEERTTPAGFDYYF